MTGLSKLGILVRLGLFPVLATELIQTLVKKRSIREQFEFSLGQILQMKGRPSISGMLVDLSQGKSEWNPGHEPGRVEEKRMHVRNRGIFDCLRPFLADASKPEQIQSLGKIEFQPSLRLEARVDHLEEFTLCLYNKENENQII
jgi:hypothetical protein